MESPEILNFVVEHFLEHVFVLNNKQEIVFQTSDSKKLLGYTSNEIGKMGFQKLFLDPDFSLDDTFAKVQKYGEFFCITNFKHKTKKRVNVAFRVFLKEGDKNKESVYVIYLKDNTQQSLLRKDIIRKSLTIENLSKSRKIRDGKIEEAIYEILESSSRAMGTTRVNAWIFDHEKTQIQCIGNFDARENKLVPQDALPRIAMPLYFNLFETEKIILTTDVHTDKKAAEMYEFYLKPHNIQALMDIPIRIEGEMIGVICFENVGAPKEWTLQEQKYGLVAAQMLSLTLETHNKQTARHALEISLDEQKILLREVHHRVKNNLSIIASLMNLQAEKSYDDYHKQLFYDTHGRLDSIATVHELIYRAKSYSQLNFKDYMEEILDHIAASYLSLKNVKIKKTISDVHINISYAIPLALIVNELITNSYKHAFNKLDEGVIDVSLTEKNDMVTMLIKDNGGGFDKKIAPKNSIGMDILSGLIEQIDGNYDLITNGQGTAYKISFSKK